MNVNLGPVFDRFVADLLRTGHYQSQSEVLRAGLRLLKEQEEMRQFRLAELRREASEASVNEPVSAPVNGSESPTDVPSGSARKRSRESKQSGPNQAG
jgi:putative addiction module CopG family antidote